MAVSDVATAEQRLGAVKTATGIIKAGAQQAESVFVQGMTTTLAAGKTQREANWQVVYNNVMRALVNEANSNSTQGIVVNGFKENWDIAAAFYEGALQGSLNLLDLAGNSVVGMENLNIWILSVGTAPSIPSIPSARGLVTTEPDWEYNAGWYIQAGGLFLVTLKLPLGAAKLEVFAAENEGVDLVLNYKDGWTPEQIAAADAKVAALNDADQLVVTQVERSGTSASSIFQQNGGIVEAGQDVDHTIDLQLGGADDLSNMWPLDASVNRSLGAQIANQIRGLPLGTIIRSITILNPWVL